MNYEDFIRSKHVEAKSLGFVVDADSLNAKAFPWQRLAVSWALRRGRCALLEECGLGKTLQQLLWAEQIVRRENKPVLLLCPIGVRQQTIREAEKFSIGVPVISANSFADVKADAINVTNYEKLHKFDAGVFVGVVLDEAQILKNFSGKTKRELCKQFASTPCRLECTATPAPNDYMEIGCHSEFLGVMEGSEMLSRWFINDTMHSGGYKLLPHAAGDFWRWMCGWALCLSRPSDMGDFSDEGFDLPPIEYHYHTIECEMPAAPGFMFADDVLNVHTLHTEKRHSCEARAEHVAEIVDRERNRPWLVWCDTDYEADALIDALPKETIEVRGSHSEKVKEDGLSAFSEGRARILCSKPTVAGLGLNFQHCCNVVFVGLSYSFEQFYQAVRRSWRFGQQNPVHVHVVQSPAEEAITRRVLEKQTAHQAMQRSLADAMRQTQIELLQGDKTLCKYLPTKRMEIPKWLRSKPSSIASREMNGSFTTEIAAKS